MEADFDGEVTMVEVEVEVEVTVCVEVWVEISVVVETLISSLTSELDVSEAMAGSTELVVTATSELSSVSTGMVAEVSATASSVDVDAKVV